MSEINPDPERIKILKILRDYRGLVLREDKIDEADYTRMDEIEDYFIKLRSDRERLRGLLERASSVMRQLYFIGRLDYQGSVLADELEQTLTEVKNETHT